MAQPTNTYDSYDVVGTREDLYEGIFNTDPDETPFLSKIAKTKASNTYTEWQTDQLDAPSDANAQIEGDQVTHTAVTPTVRLGNHTQIWRKDCLITDTMEATNRAGRGRESAYQRMLKAKAMKTDMEKSAFANKARVAGGSGTARVTAGAPVWLTSNTDAGTGGADATGDGTDARTDGTQRAFTEQLLKNVLASIYDNSGRKPDCAYVGSFNKQAGSGFTGSAVHQRNDDAKTSTLHTSIDVYEYDFGVIRFEPSRHVRSRDCLILDTGMWAWAELQPMYDKSLPANGDFEAWAIYSQAALVCRNEAASGGVFDLTTS